MEGIKHKTVNVNGINMHVAEKGQGPVILFLHGFPELWYTWRHQIVAFAALGYKAVAPDLRGYGGTDAPEDVYSYSCLHVVGDLVALIESEVCGGGGVYLVAHDWGAMIAWYLCLFRPDLVKAFVSLTVPFRPRHPKIKPVEGMRALFGDEYYMCRFQEAGKIESEMAEYGAEAVIKNIITDRTPGPPLVPKVNPFGSKSNDDDMKLPPWFTQEDLDFYAKVYEQKGFTGGLNYYRALNLNWELTAAWTGAKIKVAVKYIVGDVDMVYNTPGVKEYVHGGGFKNDVPLLEECVVIQNAGHFINQERPQEINSYIHHFIHKFTTS